MEIVTYMLSGAITYRNSMGHSARVALGDIEVLSAGEGIARTAFNPEEEDAAFFQIRSAEHASELQSLLRISYAVFCLKKNTRHRSKTPRIHRHHRKFYTLTTTTT